VVHIERRRLQQRDASGRTRTVVHYKGRYRDATGEHHSEAETKLVDAERRKTEIEVALATATWRDPIAVVQGLDLVSRSPSTFTLAGAETPTAE
jgi:hypothetical protein